MTVPRSTTFILVYAAVAALGGYCVASRPAPGNSSTAGRWRTTRQLPAGHQLERADLRAPATAEERLGLPPAADVVALHLRSNVDSGVAIGPADVKPLPDIVLPGPDTAVVLVSLTGAELPLARVLTRESLVTVCAVAKEDEPWSCFKHPLSVYATHWESDTVGSAWLALHVAGGELAALSALLGAERRLLALFTPNPPSHVTANQPMPSSRPATPPKEPRT
jgi:hypothetical protein